MFSVVLVWFLSVHLCSTAAKEACCLSPVVSQRLLYLDVTLLLDVMLLLTTGTITWQLPLLLLSSLCCLFEQNIWRSVLRVLCSMYEELYTLSSCMFQHKCNVLYNISSFLCMYFEYSTAYKLFKSRSV